MRKKLTISIDEEVHRGLYRVVGSGNISRFIEPLVRPYVLEQDLADAYARMAEDAKREAEAYTFSEALIADVDAEEM